MTLHRIPIRVETLAPCLFGNGDPTGNVSASLDFVPGSVLRGWAAWRFIARGGDPDSVDFRRRYLWGGLRFLDARPALGEQVSVPAPLSLFECKRHPQPRRSIGVSPEGVETESGSHAVSDKVFEDVWGECAAQGCGAGMRRLRGWVSKGGVLRVEREISAHNTIDRDMKRPTGGGGVYSLETVSAGQAFVGSVVVKGDAAHFLEETGVRPGQPVVARLGRGRASKGLGECRVAFGEPEPLTSDVGDGIVVLDFLSRTILAGVEAGQAMSAEHVVEWARQALGLDDAPARAFVSFESVSGYSGATGLPRARDVALAAGSCVAFDAPVSSCADSVAALLESGAGLRTSEGFGEVAINGLGHALVREGVFA